MYYMLKEFQNEKQTVGQIYDKYVLFVNPMFVLT